MFVEMCPPDIVDEIRKELEGTLTVEPKDPEETQNEEVIDAEFTHINKENVSEDNE